MKKNENSKPGSRIAYLFAAYIVAIIFFTLFRLVTTMVYCSAHPTDFEGLYGQALFMGWRFDTVVSCYVLLIPLLLVLVGEFAHINKRWYYLVVHLFVSILFTVSFFACAADIPYFSYFFTRLNVYAVQWGDEASMVLDMIVSEPSYIGYFFLFLVVAALYWWLMWVVYRRLLRPVPQRFVPVGYMIVITLVLGFATFAGMRGRLNRKSPMRVGTAYFCNNAFLNKIGLNPMFTFYKSVEEQWKNANSEVRLMDEGEARKAAMELLNGDDVALAEADTVALPDGMNVVVVLMESMSANKTGFLTPSSDLTPNLDSLMRQSLTFSQAYSAGIHTHNGIFSSLYAMPALLRQHMLKRAVMLQMCGLPHALRGAGYSTSFFITHDSEFDNMNGFLRGNDYERVYAQKDYDASQILGTWGVPDHVMLDKAIEVIDTMDKQRPFFVTCLTCSDHGPYEMPTDIDFVPRHSVITEKIVEYADWSIGRFMRKASERPWFDNTVFVFVADHGASMSGQYDMALSYNHVPLFYHCPSHIRPAVIERMAMQIDLTPTLLGMLPVAWDNHTLGIDLLRRQRPCSYFSADDKIGVVDGEWFYVYGVAERDEHLYRYMDNDPVDYFATESAHAAPLRKYAFVMLQTAQSMIMRGETRCGEE